MAIDRQEPMSKKNVPRESASIVHKGLKRRILEGELAPGQWLSQVQIAKEFDVSRGPVREAIRLLEREGLLESRVNHRARVAPFSPTDLEELYAIRILTESLSAGQTAGVMTDSQMAELERLLDELERLGADEIERWEEVHRSFHLALVAPAGPRLLVLTERSIDHSERYRRLYISHGTTWPPVGSEDHRELARACRRRDGDAARSLLARHLSRTALTLLMTAAPEHDPSLVRAAVRQMTAGDLRPEREPLVNLGLEA